MKSALNVGCSILIILVGGLTAWHTYHGGRSVRQDVRLPLGPPDVTFIDLDDAPFLGSREASFAIVQFSDFRCAYCGAFAYEILPQLRAQLIDTAYVLSAFRHFPPSSGFRPTDAATAAVCAAEQSRFWAFHDRLFAPPGKQKEDDLRGLAQEIGMSMASFDACRSRAEKVVERDRRLAHSLRLPKAPMFLAGRLSSSGRVEVRATLSGIVPVDQFDKALRSLGMGAVTR